MTTDDYNAGFRSAMRVIAADLEKGPDPVRYARTIRSLLAAEEADDE